ncbi:MAG: phosphatidylinositol mannoside acyltransferase [Nitriliruptorales bacterium]|nr:phosphatidylinositol mannoside acyltransferase [Nitriliruptorales bacterium]
MSRSADLDALPPPGPETLRLKAAYWGYRSAWEAAARLPQRAANRVPTTIGRSMYLSASVRQRSQVRRNMARISGLAGTALERLVRDAYVSYARYWLDSFRLHTMNGAEVMRQSSAVNCEAVDELLADGDGAILATGHLGSWDIGAMFSATRGWKMTVVAEVVEPRRLFDRFVELRHNAGIDVIPLVRGGDMVSRLEERVRNGGLATLLADRDLTRKGPIVEFFGEPCRLPPGVASLARRTGRPVAVGAFFSKPRGWEGYIEDVIDISDKSIEDGTQALASVMERLISRHPEQWHVFVPNWLADREPDHPSLRQV